MNEKFVLLWNGEIFHSNLKQIQDLLDSDLNDGESLFRALNASTSQDTAAIFDIFSSLCGPFAFVLLCREFDKVIFGRDRFGRRSLIAQSYKSFDKIPLISLSSTVLPQNFQYIEVPSTGIFLATSNDTGLVVETFIPWSEPSIARNKSSNPPFSTLDPLSLIHTFPSSISFNPSLNPVEQFYEVLFKAVRVRLQKASHSCKNCLKFSKDCSHSRFCLLFSGGLDSAILAALIDKILPISEPIDLLNVAFDHFSGGKGCCAADSPDRITGISCLQQLERISPSRSWNFVKINITNETVEKIKASGPPHSYLLKPGADTILDESLGLAVWFAARGRGLLNGQDYESPAKIVFTGIGADEQLGGYSRHRMKFGTGADSQALQNELDIDLERIGDRNLSRDDRMISDHGREGRFPFLDENLVSFLRSVPLTQKMDLTLPQGQGDKRLLRLVADQFLNLGHSTCDSTTIPAAWQPKRAMQFGSRIAKVKSLNTGNLKGHDRF
ncbi:Asparagine synthetase domain-containing protein 1 [Cichlidogyrus casuarinus]|uniref:Asparagine synthetase domain-containing protein 1 n=1 Tax=Cichlidogyrus casuarinus TaxID=1844966 RepID=A0ABD2Q039_9PLAT